MSNPFQFGIRVTAGLALLGALALAGTLSAGAQDKRKVYTEDDVRWQASLKPGQTLEIVNTNGEIEASPAGGASAEVEGVKRGEGDAHQAFVEVVEYSDGATVCAIYAKSAEDAAGRCHRGGVNNESHNWSWGRHSVRIAFNVKVPAGVNLKAMTTNGNIGARNLKSVVQASTTNGSVDVSTSEWASATTTNGKVEASMGSAKWSGELRLTSTNGSVHASLPSSAEFSLEAATTNGGIHTDFPVTVQGSLNSKHLAGTIGNGGRELHLTTTNGGIEIRKL
jgi:hypothetical protein